MKNHFYTFLAILSLFSLMGCTSDIPEDNNGITVCRMHLDGTIGSYTDDLSSRATLALPDGTKLYLYLGSKAATAIYHSSQNEWSLTYTGSLSGSGSCSAYYLPATTESDGSISLSSSSTVYSSTSGTYACSADGSITVKATLNPHLSRIRLKGTSGTQVKIEGMKIPSSFSVPNASLQTTSPTVSVTIGTDGYSPYIYYLEPSSANLTVIHSGKMFTIKTPLSSGGTSGFMNLPTESSHKGWTMTDKPTEPDDSKAVDLGLSVKWAAFNVGANSPEEYGDYFAWGEVESKSIYDWSHYKWYNGSSSKFTKYCTASRYGTVDDKTVLDPEDDVAHVKWGGSWRMPTKAEQIELLTQCTWTWTTQNGVNGYKVTSKTNGNSIFLPAAGYRYDGSLNYAGSYGYCWSSSLRESYSYGAYLLSFNSGDVSRSDYYRWYGFSVRPVCP